MTARPPHPLRALHRATRAVARRAATLWARLTGRRGTVGEDAGRWGERQAAVWLRRRGYRILGRRVRPNRRDELDLVVRRGDTLAFVEVKTRRNEAYGRPAAAVGRAKQRSLCRAASGYLRRLGYPALVYRFDIVEVVGLPGSEPAIRHIENSFPFAPRYRFPVRAPQGRPRP